MKGESKRWKYNAARGGHASGDHRDKFCGWIMDGIIPGDEAKWLTGQLWNCKDVSPSSLCDEFDLRRGSTYAVAARKVRREL